jgi:hypothetical protein
MKRILGGRQPDALGRFFPASSFVFLDNVILQPENLRLNAERVAKTRHFRSDGDSAAPMSGAQPAKNGFQPGAG